jgi:hypothetical protein
MRFLKILIIILISSLFLRNAKAAYNPFEPDVIKVTNTAVVNVNTNPQAEFNNINTTPIFNTNPNVFTSVTSNGVVCVPGLYLVDIALYHTTTSQRTNPAIEVTVNSVSTGIRGANGYVRVGSGHNESTTTVSDLVQLTTASKIGFDTLLLSAAGNVAAPVAQSSMRIVRIDDR